MLFLFQIIAFSGDKILDRLIQENTTKSSLVLADSTTEPFMGLSLLPCKGDLAESFIQRIFPSDSKV